MEDEQEGVQVPWELTLLVTWRSPLSHVLTLNITPGPMGCPPPTPFLVAAISCFLRQVATEFRFGPKEAELLVGLSCSSHNRWSSLRIQLVFVAIRINVLLCVAAQRQMSACCSVRKHMVLGSRCVIFASLLLTDFLQSVGTTYICTKGKKATCRIPET